MQSIWIAKLAAKCDNFSETTKKEPEGERDMSDRVPTNNEIIVVINDTPIIYTMIIYTMMNIYNDGYRNPLRY